MTYFTTSLAVVAGACWAVAALFAFQGARRVRSRTVDLLFAAFATSYGAAVLSARAVYVSSTAAEAQALDRLTALFAAVGFALLLLFAAAYTEAPRRTATAARLLSVLFFALAAVAVVIPGLLIGNATTVVRLELPWGEEVLVSSAEGSPLEPLVLLAQLATIVLLTAMTVIEVRRGQREKGVFLSLGVGWFVATVVVDLLVDLDVLDFVFLSDVGFLGFVVATSLQLAKSMLDTEQQLRTYQSSLEDMVAERTAALERAQAELIEQAATQAAVTERARLSRDLHDAVTQLLFAASLVAQSLPRLVERDPQQAQRSSTELVRLTRGALAEMRTLLRELRPHTIVESDLTALITQLVDGLGARQDLATHITVKLDQPVPPEVHIAVYRIAQEALSNVAKHASASAISVELSGDGRQVEMHIVDDGSGFDPSAHVPRRGIGIGVMAERAAEIGAALTVDSAEERGTHVSLCWPAPPESSPR